jgi:MiaB/RimO family radical SAM methylthiotransferase
MNKGMATTLQRHLTSRFFSTERQHRRRRRLPKDGKMLQHFLLSDTNTSTTTSSLQPYRGTFHIKTYGCQMNVNDTDIVRSVLLKAGWQETGQEQDATVLLTNTCAIREHAETKVWDRLKQLRALQRKSSYDKNAIVGVLGCMAERLQQDLLQDNLADLVVGPDAYRDLPRLLDTLLDAEEEQAFNVQLSLEETYADIQPVRRSKEDVSAFVSIQRGCANRCSFCIVPFTRGHERSRPMQSILDEIQQLHFEENVKEVTLLGQNVNSYHDTSQAARLARPHQDYRMSNEGFRSRIRRQDAGYFFADLLAAVSDISPELRVRFTSPHPKDYPSTLLALMAERPNICQHLHMPAQSGSTTMLQRMKRGYTREAYLHLMDDVHAILPDVAISSDFIAGFCGETEEEHADTLSLMEHVRYDQAYMFAYSMREKTHAHRTMHDNVPEEVKQRRLREIIDVFHRNVQAKNEEQEVGRLRLVLVEGESKRSQPGNLRWHGRTDQNKRLVFAMAEDRQCWIDDDLFVQRGLLVDPIPIPTGRLVPGDYVAVEVTEAKGHTLRGKLLWKTSLARFHASGLSGIDMESKERAASILRQLSQPTEPAVTLVHC